MGVSTQVQSYGGVAREGAVGIPGPGSLGGCHLPEWRRLCKEPGVQPGVSNLRCQLGPGEVEQILVYRCICGRLYIYRVFKALKLNEVTQRMDRYKVRGVIWDSPSSGGRRSGEPGKEQA